MPKCRAPFGSTADVSLCVSAGDAPHAAARNSIQRWRDDRDGIVVKRPTHATTRQYRCAMAEVLRFARDDTYVWAMPRHIVTAPPTSQPFLDAVEVRPS